MTRGFSRLQEITLDSYIYCTNELLSTLRSVGFCHISRQTVCQYLDM